MKIVVLDGYSINPGDLSWSPLSALGTSAVLTVLLKRKFSITLATARFSFVSRMPHHLQHTGKMSEPEIYRALRQRVTIMGIQSSRGNGYSRVPRAGLFHRRAAHFALILELTNRSGSYNASVQRGKWYESKDFTFIEEPLTLLSGKSLGIIGYE